MKLEDILRKVPKYKEFLTVDELNENSQALVKEHKDVAELVEIGKSTNGEDIQMLKIGNGEKTAFLFGLPHPNEPIGSMTLETLSNILVKDNNLRHELDFTWLIVKCIDTDGARLNEAWFKGKFTPLKYALNYYRPADYEQVEWTFPVDYKKLHFNKPLPETKALMKVIKDFKPDFMYSLHNDEFCGVYFYVSDGYKELYPKFHKLVKSQNLPLHLGEPEAPFIKKLDKAIFKDFGIADIYDFYEGLEKEPLEYIVHGTSSYDYFKNNCNGFSLVCEMPYFYEPVIGDNKLTNIEQRKTLLKSAEENEEIYKQINSDLEKIKEDANTNTRLFRALEYFVNDGLKYFHVFKEHVKTSSEYGGKATKAQLFDNTVASKCRHMPSYGLLLRIVKEAYENTGKPYLKDLENLYFKKINSFNEYLVKNSNIRIVPIQKLVKVQLGSALEVVDYIKNKV